MTKWIDINDLYRILRDGSWQEDSSELIRAAFATLKREDAETFTRTMFSTTPHAKCITDGKKAITATWDDDSYRVAYGHGIETGEKDDGSVYDTYSWNEIFNIIDALVKDGKWSAIGSDECKKIINHEAGRCLDRLRLPHNAYGKFIDTLACEKRYDENEMGEKLTDHETAERLKAVVKDNYNTNNVYISRYTYIMSMILEIMTNWKGVSEPTIEKDTDLTYYVSNNEICDALNHQNGINDIQYGLIHHRTMDEITDAYKNRYGRSCCGGTIFDSAHDYNADTKGWTLKANTFEENEAKRTISWEKAAQIVVNYCKNHNEIKPSEKESIYYRMSDCEKAKKELDRKTKGSVICFSIGWHKANSDSDQYGVWHGGYGKMWKTENGYDYRIIDMPSHIILSEGHTSDKEPLEWVKKNVSFGENTCINEILYSDYLRICLHDHMNYMEGFRDGVIDWTDEHMNYCDDPEYNPYLRRMKEIEKAENKKQAAVVPAVKPVNKPSILSIGATIWNTIKPLPQGQLSFADFGIC